MNGRREARVLARGLGWLRVGIGAATFALPRLGARLMLGPSADQAGVAFGIRGMGARDLAVGLGALRASSDREVARWMGVSALIDAGDTLTLLLAARRVPPLRNAVLVSLALAGAVSELLVRRRLR